MSILYQARNGHYLSCSLFSEQNDVLWAQYLLEWVRPFPAPRSFCDIVTAYRLASLIECGYLSMVMQS